VLRFLLSAAAVQWTEQAKKIKAILHKVPRLDVTKVSSKENLPSIVRTKSGGRLKYSAPAGGDDTLRRKGAVFVEPVLVAEVEYRAWTDDGKLRHASFKRIRGREDDAAVFRLE